MTCPNCAAAEARATAAEGERDALRADLFAARQAVLTEGLARIAEAALAEARGREKALREALARLLTLRDGPRDDAYKAQKPFAWAEARAALALPYSTEGRPLKELQNQGAVAPGLKSEEGK